MKKSLLVGRVATLARDLELSGLNLNDVGLHVYNYDANDETASNKSLNTNKSLRGGILNGIDMSSRRARIAELLGEFEEPEDLRKKNVSDRSFSFCKVWLPNCHAHSADSIRTEERLHWGDHSVSPIFVVPQLVDSLQRLLWTSSDSPGVYRIRGTRVQASPLEYTRAQSAPIRHNCSIGIAALRGTR